ncbi:MAG: pantetheine-phosphate adenylyltransferase [Candidatus Omnitrophica bacterium]|nr:pantetheine-phosphate adenylyltransferase [Candidatus Omnitrophota bacterium]
MPNSAAIYPGSFDPVTYGHVDLIKRASSIFSEVVVAVANNMQKQPLFNTQERIAMLKEATSGLSNIRIEIFDGLVVDYARESKINVLIRGLRMVSDFEYEFQMALTNRRLAEEIETVFLMPSEGYSFLSSSLIKEAASLGADLTSFVPNSVADRLKKKLNK